MGLYIGNTKYKVMSGSNKASLLSYAYDSKIEYLESTGTQYIDLPYGFYKTDRIEITAALSTTSNDKYLLTSKTWNNNNNRFAMCGCYDARYTIGYGNQTTGTTIISASVVPNYAFHTWEYNNYVFSISDLNITKNVASITFGSETASLRLFYGYNSNTIGRIKSFKHYKNGNIVLDLIPVRVGQVGYMYDTISHKLFGNSGTGSFIVGNDKN